MFTFLPNLLREASKIMLSAHDIDHSIDVKPGEANFVTAYDVAVQDFLYSAIAREMPDAVIIGEESDDNPMESLASKTCFIIDPIDGTTNFIHNYRTSCISIGVIHAGQAVYGAIYNPYQNTLYRAERGRGAVLESPSGITNIRVSDRDLPNALSCFGTAPYYREELGDITFDRAKWLFMHTRDLRRSGSAAIDLATVASGSIDVFFEYRLSPWDFAAGSLLIEEAGGVITQFDGSPVTYGAPCSILAGNPACHEAALASGMFYL